MTNDFESIFKALADHSRRQILDRLREEGGLTLNEITADLAMTRQAATKHLAILERAGLVVFERKGRERLHYLNALPISEIADRWIAKFERHRVQALSDLRTSLENSTMADGKFVYVLYIKAPQEKVFAALTNAEFTKQYWGARSIASDWKVGSPVLMTEKDGKHDWEGTVLEYDPPKRLSYTFTWLDKEGKLLPPTRVTFDLKNTGESTKLKIVHDQFPGDVVEPSIEAGWPAILSNMKSLLETGKSMDFMKLWE